MKVSNKELMNTLKKLGRSGKNKPEEIAEFLATEGLRFDPRDISTWGQFLLDQYGRAAGQIYVPEWLVDLFTSLGNDASPEIICDPWAGVGFLAGALRAECQPKRAYAFTQNSGEYAIGRVLVPDVNWELGDSLNLLDSATEEFDLVASILPMGLRAKNPLNVTTTSKENIKLRDDLGDLLMVSTLGRLSSKGVGLFVVTPSFFFSQRSVFHRFPDLGLGIEAALLLPPGTFASHANFASYLLIIRRTVTARMFVAQVSHDMEINRQVLENFRQSKEGGALELGRFVAPETFVGLDALRAAEKIAQVERQLGTPAISLGEIALAINPGRVGNSFEFKTVENSFYVPLVGNHDAIESPDEMVLRKHHYAQVSIDPERSSARFVARFLNTALGKELRAQSMIGTVTQVLNAQALSKLRIFIPEISTQNEILAIEGRIVAEQNIVLGLQTELEELRRDLWADPRTRKSVNRRLRTLSEKLDGQVKQHQEERLDQWFETLPFPLATILRAWQATPTEDFKTRYEHLLHFFEATAEFVSVILLSAFNSNDAIWGIHKSKLTEVLRNQNLSYQRATFGTWKVVVEYLGKQTRLLLEGEKNEDAQVCVEMFRDSSLGLPKAISQCEVSRCRVSVDNIPRLWRYLVCQEALEGLSQEIKAKLRC